MNATLKFQPVEMRYISGPLSDEQDEKDLSEFADKVSAALAKGWELGGPLMHSGTGLIIQPLVRTEPRIVLLPNPPDSPRIQTFQPR